MAARSSVLFGLLRRRSGWSWTTTSSPLITTTTTRSFQVSAALLRPYNQNSKNKNQKNNNNNNNYRDSKGSRDNKGSSNNNKQKMNQQKNKNKQQLHHQKQQNNQNNIHIHHRNKQQQQQQQKNHRQISRKPSIWDNPDEDDDDDENDIFKVFVPHNHGGRINWKQVPVEASQFQKGPMDSDYESEDDDEDDEDDDEGLKFRAWNTDDEELYGDDGIHIRDDGFMVLGRPSRKQSKQINVQSSQGTKKWDGTTVPARPGQVPSSSGYSKHPLMSLFDSDDDDDDDEVDLAKFFGQDMGMGGPELEEILQKAHACVTAQMTSQLGEDLEVGAPFSQSSSTVLAGKGNYKTRLELEFPIYSKGRKQRFTGRVVATGTNLELLQVNAHGQTVSLNTTITRKREIFENDDEIVEAEIIEEKTESKVM
jgi:hypothetical protein